MHRHKKRIPFGERSRRQRKAAFIFVKNDIRRHANILGGLFFTHDYLHGKNGWIDCLFLGQPAPFPVADGEDPWTEDEIEEVRQELLAVFDHLHSQGITLLLATHDIDFAYRWADRIHVMANGQCTAAFDATDFPENAHTLAAAGLPVPGLIELHRQLVAAGLCAWLAVVSVRFLLLIAPFEQVTPTLALPTVLIYSVFLLAFALMAVCFAGRALLLAKEV